MGKHISHRENSRINWGKTMPDGADSNPDRDAIELGCLLRIADATEAMAKNHVKLIDERDYLSRRNNEQHDTIARLERQRAALRGQVTRLKKKLAAKEPGHDR